MNKPKFNPNQPFEVVKPKFDPSQPFEEVGQSDLAPEESGVGSTIIDKLAQGVSGGLADEASGGMEALGQMAGVQGLGGKIKDIQMSDHGPTMDWEILKHAYLNARNKDRDVLKKESADHPFISGASELAGAVASPINKLAAGASAIKGGAMIGGAQAFGNSEGDNLADLAKDTAIGAGLGGAAGYVGDKVIAPAIGKATNYIGEKLGGAAENLAENATGATGAQASKFQDGAGRELLDRKLVRFGDNAKNVADRVSGAVDSANSNIDSALNQLDAKGATASADNVVAELQKQIQEMSQDPSKAGTARKLQSIIDDITATGNSKVPLSLGEETKRGFRKAAGNWMDPDAGQAGKSAYLAYRDEVEKAAQAADPNLAGMFKEGKETYGLLAPIQEAAEKRASTVKQSPFGGLGDWSAAAAGGATMGPLGAIGSVIAKKVIAPRITSSTAVTFDAISKQLLKSPQMLQISQSNPAAFQALVHKLESQAGAFEGSVNQSLPRAADKDNGNGAMNFKDSMGKDAILQKTQGSKYGQVLQNAAKNGDQSLSAAHYILASRDQGYRKLLEDGDE